MTRVVLAALCFAPFVYALVVARRDRKRMIAAARRPIANRWAVQR